LKSLKKDTLLWLEEEDLKKLKRLAEKKGILVQTLLRMEIKELLSGFVDDGEVWSPKDY
jgi:predicted DNA binding CopG/RHH family protein